MNLPLWQSTILALLGCAVGLLLHLRWHPLRQHLSDAWDFVRMRPVLVAWVAGAALLAEALGGDRTMVAASFSLGELMDWKGLILPLSREAAAHLALLPHALVAPWPLACLGPVLLAILTVRIWRWPYRYGERKPGPEQDFGLLAATAAGFIWLVLEAEGLRRMLPEWLEMLKLGLRYLFTALAAAGMQVWLTRLVIAWERPQDTEADSDATAALEHTFARWQGVAWLAGFDLLWSVWRLSHAGAPHSLSGWLWIELLLVFAALPLAVAVSTQPGRFIQQGAVALRILFRAAVPLLLLGITALAILILALYAGAVARVLCADRPFLSVIAQALNALGLAMLNCWLLLAALLLMLRLGFPRPPSAPASA